MRISDWSSDVCSSDLRRVPMPRTGQVPGDFQSDSERAPPVVDIRKADDPVEQGAKDEHLTAMDRIARPCDLEMAIHRFFADTENARRLARRLAAGRPKIGRASCRERVCQYV